MSWPEAPEDTGVARYEPRLTITDVRAAKPTYIYYAMRTAWWTFRSEDLGRIPNSSVMDPPGPGLPCDPRGSVLLMTSEGDWESFLTRAEANPAHYGKHGLRAFEAALHGNVTLKGGAMVLPNGCRNEEGHPWSFRTWEAYNQLIDKYDAQKKIEATIGKEMNAKVEKMAAEIRRLESLRDSKRNNEKLN